MHSAVKMHQTPKSHCIAAQLQILWQWRSAPWLQLLVRLYCSRLPSTLSALQCCGSPAHTWLPTTRCPLKSYTGKLLPCLACSQADGMWAGLSMLLPCAVSNAVYSSRLVSVDRRLHDFSNASSVLRCTDMSDAVV